LAQSEKNEVSSLKSHILTKKIPLG